MTKKKLRILSMLLALCLMAWLFPVNAMAATTVTWSEILREIASGATKGNGWDTDVRTNTIIIAADTTVNGDATIDYRVTNNGTIAGGTFNKFVTNSTGTITGGTFNGSVNSKGTINGGTFNGTVLNYAQDAYTGTINNGNFIGNVTNNNGTISGGTFKTNPSGGGNISGIKIDPTLGNPANAGGTSASEGGSSGGHSHNLRWIVTLEPTGTEDGRVEYRCEGCDHVEAAQPISYFEVIIKNLIQEIQEAPENGTVTVDNEFLRCFSNEIIEALLARPDVTVMIHFTDQEVAYSLTIPAGQAPTDGQEWYGYYYLGALYGWTGAEPLTEDAAS